MTNIINNHANKVLINGYSYGRDKDKPAIILGITTKYPDIGIINEPIPYSIKSGKYLTPSSAQT